MARERHWIHDNPAYHRLPGLVHPAVQWVEERMFRHSREVPRFTPAAMDWCTNTLGYRPYVKRVNARHKPSHRPAYLLMTFKCADDIMLFKIAFPV